MDKKTTMIHKTPHNNIRLTNTNTTKNRKVLRNDELSPFALVAPDVVLARNPMASHERENDGVVTRTNGTYPWLLVML